ncbi:MAG: D-alanine--D-alanine ligase [Spirochaetes bacterium]|nr:D-alanine--D-alanine ligase [Spirochaetota bacterium]
MAAGAKGANGAKKNVGLLFGGRSAEHEVSLQSAKNIFEAVDRERFEPLPIGIDKTGRWLFYENSNFLLDPDDPKKIRLSPHGKSVAIFPETGRLLRGAGVFLDAVFPVLHGPFGEDGTLQGLLKLAGIPFVGPSVLGSAAAMDKDVMKRLARDAGIPTAKFLTLKKHGSLPSFSEITGLLGCPFFLKPANMGSSVGVSKVYDEAGYVAAADAAFQYDVKLLAEEFIAGRELECAVLGNEEPAASVVGEVIPLHDFYSYDAKYLDEAGAQLKIPAAIDRETADRVKVMAVKVFQTLCCEGLSRIDFFLKEDGQVIVNELNTMPGFTAISMYPKLWEASGLSYTDLITRLIELAISRFESEKPLKTSL